MKTTAKKSRCPDCKQEVTVDDDGIAVCENCAIMTCTDQCKVADKILCTIAILDQNQNNRKYQVSITPDVLRRSLKVFMEDKINFLKQFMKKDLRPHLTPEAILFHI